MNNSRTNSPQLPNTSLFQNSRPQSAFKVCQNAVIDREIISELLSVSGKNTKFLPLSIILQLKNKRELLYFPIDFEELTIDGHIETGAVKSVVSEAHLRKIQLLALQTISKERHPPGLQIVVANGHLETLSATVELQYEVGDILFKERVIVTTNLLCRLTGLLFLERNSTILDMRQGVINISLLSKQLKHADNTSSNINEPLINHTEIRIQPEKQTVINFRS